MNQTSSLCATRVLSLTASLIKRLATPRRLGRRGAAIQGFFFACLFLIAGSDERVLAQNTEISPEAPTSDTSTTETLLAAVWKDNERVRKVLEPTSSFSSAEKYERMQGGAGTQLTNVDRNAYSQETSTLGFESLQNFKLGNALFNKLWVASPSSTQASDGLGPLYSARACQSCHIKDGRGQLPQLDEKTASLVLQLKNEDVSGWGPDPVYGGQFQTSAVPGVEAEGLVDIGTEPLLREFADGLQMVLEKPVYSPTDLAYGDLHPATRLSPRLAPSVIGLGLLEAIDDEHILAYADPDDANNDGISGRPNWQSLGTNEQALGRFGHKAAMSTIREQNIHALFTDMGLSSSAAPLNDPKGDCTRLQSVCKTLAHGEQLRLGKGEATDTVVDLITFYTHNLALPGRRDVSDENVLAGKKLFYDSGCIACHVPKHVSSRDDEQKELQFQLIWPYTDLLLHDMGPDLADNAGEGVANGTEWRTAPLWGIGLAKAVNPNTTFLHDGRAQTLLEAVLWHGGEAEASLEKVLTLDEIQRQQLVSFLESL